MMKKTLFAALSFAVCFSAAASVDSLDRALHSSKLSAKEVELGEAGYELKSVSDGEAGEAFRSKCGCSVYTATFKKSVRAEGGEVTSSERKFSLTFNMDQSEELTEMSPAILPRR